MPLFQKENCSIYYEIRGQGYPLILLPPGGMAATIEFWQRTAFNAVEIFSEDFRVIAIDQRNSGRSSGPVTDGNPWDAYLADHVGLLNHLGIERCLVLGCCIGVSYALNLLRAIPHRVAAAVLEQPVGIDAANRQIWPNAFHDWAEALLVKRPEIDRATLENFGRRMWSEDFVLSVSRDDVKACTTPLLVLPGIDLPHPTAIGHEIARLAPNSEMVEPWKEPAELLPGVSRTRPPISARTHAALESHGGTGSLPPFGALLAGENLVLHQTQYADSQRPYLNCERATSTVSTCAWQGVKLWRLDK
jgi:pimeloyl-ACP methyl ester carboxylesterase